MTLPSLARSQSKVAPIGVLRCQRWQDFQANVDGSADRAMPGHMTPHPPTSTPDRSPSPSWLVIGVTTVIAAVNTVWAWTLQPLTSLAPGPMFFVNPYVLGGLSILSIAAMVGSRWCTRHSQASLKLSPAHIGLVLGHVAWLIALTYLVTGLGFPTTYAPSALHRRALEVRAATPPRQPPEPGTLGTMY